MKEFVAITDEMFYSHPEVYDRLVPFTHDVACRHLLRQPLDIDGYADILEYSVTDQQHVVAAETLHSERAVSTCNAH